MKYSVLTIMDNYSDRERSVSELYEQTEWECLLAERLGFHGFFVAEHHFSDYGVSPDPLILLSSLARATDTIALGTGISIVTFHDPRVLAARYAMVDILSRGRFVLGIGSGFLPNEFEALELDPRQKRQRFDEAVRVIEPLLRGEEVSFDGSFFKFKNLRLNTPPFREGGPPLYMAVMARDAFFHAAKQGRRLIAAPYASLSHLDELPGLLRDVERGRAEGGHPPREDIFSLHCFVDATDGAAVERARPHFELYMDTRLYAQKISYDDFLRKELSLIGSVDTVAARLHQMRRWGVGHVKLCFNFGLMSREDTARSMSLFANDVMRKYAALGAAA